MVRWSFVSVSASFSLASFAVKVGVSDATPSALNVYVGLSSSLTVMSSFFLGTGGILQSVREEVVVVLVFGSTFQHNTRKNFVAMSGQNTKECVTCTIQRGYKE